MKTDLILLFIFSLLLISCDSNETAITGDFEFVSEYSVTVTVGGVVGITERTFKVGETYQGTDKGSDIITLRIAEHTERNKECPNSWCYQELLEVPREFLRKTEEVETLAKKYINSQIVGIKSLADCRHIATATVNDIEILTSWNFKHIVNLNKIHLYNGVNLQSGYRTVEIRIPREIVNYED